MRTASSSLIVKWPCYFCGQGFRSKQALSVHACKLHGIQRPIRRYITTTHCCACLLEFHTRERLISHISEKSPVCASYFVANITPLSAEATKAPDIEGHSAISANMAHGRSWTHTGGEPCYRLVGSQPVDVITGTGTHNYGRNRHVLGELLLDELKGLA